MVCGSTLLPFYARIWTYIRPKYEFQLPIRLSYQRSCSTCATNSPSLSGRSLGLDAGAPAAQKVIKGRRFLDLALIQSTSQSSQQLNLIVYLIEMHASIASSTSSSVAMCATKQASSPSTSTSVATREGEISSSTTLNSSPQCCHCGYRGSHSPNCPFK